MCFLYFLFKLKMQLNYSEVKLNEVIGWKPSFPSLSQWLGFRKPKCMAVHLFFTQHIVGYCNCLQYIIAYCVIYNTLIITVIFLQYIISYCVFYNTLEVNVI